MKTISKLFLLFSIILLSSCDETELDQTVTNQVNPQRHLHTTLHQVLRNVLGRYFRGWLINPLKFQVIRY